MAINVDTVYQRVLSILNKEQRGFLTPQKFNLYANQVQLNILETYFYDLDFYLTQAVGNNTQHADMVSILETKIAKFEKTATPAFATPHMLIPSDAWRLSSVSYLGRDCDKISRKSLRYILKSPIAAPSAALPVYIEDEAGLKVYGDAILGDGDKANIEIDYIRTPTSVVWGYTSVLGSAQYNAGSSTNFELDPSEETDLTIKILALAGLEIKDLGIYETASRESGTEQQQETR